MGGYREFCRKGLHRFTEFNTVLERQGDRVFRRCLECRLLSEKRNKAKKKRARQRYRRSNPLSPRTTCKSGRHLWVEENIEIRKNGCRCCKPCRRLKQQSADHRRIRRRCITKGCRKTTARSSGDTYICPEHRQNPPVWLVNRIIRKEVRIVGTEVLAA
jgi:hypothetical protein